MKLYEYLLKDKFITNIFTYFSVILFFNQEIQFKNIHKRWINIQKNMLTWDHKYGEISNVINNIDIETPHIDKGPRDYFYRKKLNCLIKECSTKYEVFTSEIINTYFNSNDDILIIHCKNVRKEMKLDIPLITLQIIHHRGPHEDVYRIKDSYELENFIELFFLVSNKTKIICFTDWRILYRKGYSFSHIRCFFINHIIKKILNKLFVSIIPIIITENYMYALNIGMINI
ncbi:MAG: hypothetical protein CMF80_06895 [Candidatus Marinimicrobia bacterium]|nr:hypothetical protein [Candidatus Neomarinimicrobiota bacterium]|tara:strand:- start:842 stop:1531 length:690 start_codon:yes stop_codon:yes gene_type:complete